MNISERNKKVALARWKNYRNAQENNIAKGKEADYWKAAVCGFLAGDGSVQVREDNAKAKHHEISFFPDDKFMLEMYIHAIKFVYKISPSVKNRGKFFIVRIFSKAIVQDILKSANFGIKGWTTPRDILNNNKNKSAWLRAFFSAEGYVGPDRIKIQTVNKEGMTEVSKLLNDLGIKHHCYDYNPKKDKYSPVRIIVIGTKAMRQLFLFKVGFWHTKKEARLKETLGL